MQWADLVAGALVALLIGALTGSLFGTRQTLASVRADRDVERERVADLLSRLAARTHGEYAAFAAPEPAPTYADGEKIYDATGLVEVQLEPQDDLVS